MTNVNEFNSMVESKLEAMMETLQNTKAVNIAEIRDTPDNDFSKVVFERMKAKLENDGIPYGCSNTDGRFWLL